MAIFQPGPGFTQPNVNAAMNFTFGAQGQHVINQANNNRSKKARGLPSDATTGPSSFPVLDALITHLDAVYEMLPNQADWVAAAATMAGLWNLCANCEPDTQAKKFFRQENFWRKQLGLPMITSPVATLCTPLGVAPIMQVIAVNSVVVEAAIGWGTTISDQWLFAQIGEVMANPGLLYTNANRDTFFETGPVVDWCIAIINAKYGPVWPPSPPAWFVKLCRCAPDGTPSISTQVEVSLIN